MRYNILLNGEVINTIVADQSFVTAYCAENGYTYEEAPLPEPEPAPTLDDRVSDLEANKADKTEVAAVWDQMAAAYQEGVQSA